MKRERLTQIVLVIVGLLNLAMIYFLYTDLRHSSWLLVQKNECEPMFLSFFIPAGIFLLMAARRPSEHRSMIALAAWWNISHGTVMGIQTVEAADAADFLSLSHWEDWRSTTTQILMPLKCQLWSRLRYDTRPGRYRE